MWLFFIIQLFFIQSLSHAADFCQLDPTSYCKINEVSFHIPDDETDFNNLCGEYVKYIECLQVYQKLCPDGYLIVFFTAGDSAINYKLIHELCRNDTSLHTEFSEHVSCITSEIESSLGECTLESKLKTEEYFEFLRRKIQSEELKMKTVIKDYFAPPECLWHAYTTSCVLYNIKDTCGDPAAKVATDIMQQSSYLLEACNTRDIHKIQNGFLSFLGNSHEAQPLSDAVNSLEFKEVVDELEVW